MPAAASSRIWPRMPFGVGQPDVGDAIRGEDDPVDAAVAEQRLAGQPVAEP